MKRPSRATVLKLSALVAVVGVVTCLALREFDFAGWTHRTIDYFRDAGPVPFFAAMALIPVVGVPMSPFTLIAGPVFGPVMGVGNVIACALLAEMINVALCYWIAAWALRPLMLRLVRWLGYELPVMQPNAAWTLTLVLRIVPGTPFFLQNYLLGLARVPFGIYMLVSTIVPAAYLTGMILFGDALMRGDRGAMIGAGAIFLVAGGILHQIRRRLARRPVGEGRAEE